MNHSISNKVVHVYQAYNKCLLVQHNPLLSTFESAYKWVLVKNDISDLSIDTN